MEYFQLGDRSFNDFGGILHIPIGDYATLNYHIGFGTSLNKGIFVHTTAGAVAGIWTLNELNGSGLGYVSFLLALVPEGVGVYIPMGKYFLAGGTSQDDSNRKFLGHFSINPLSVEYFYNSRTPEEWGKMSCDFVFRIKMHTGFDWGNYIAPQIAATYIYTPGQTTTRWGVKAGLTFGFEGEEF